MKIFAPGLARFGWTDGTASVLGRTIPLVLAVLAPEVASSPLSLLRMLAPELKSDLGLIAAFHTSEPNPASASKAPLEAFAEAAVCAGRTPKW